MADQEMIDRMDNPAPQHASKGNNPKKHHQQQSQNQQKGKNNNRNKNKNSNKNNNVQNKQAPQRQCPVHDNNQCPASNSCSPPPPPEEDRNTLNPVYATDEKVRNSFITLQDMMDEKFSSLLKVVLELKASIPPPSTGPIKIDHEKFVKDLDDIARDFKPRVPAAYVDWYVDAIGGKPGVDFLVTNVGAFGENPHTPEAILRTIANNYAVPEVIKINPKAFMENPIITFLYGTENRDRNTVARYNRELVKKGYPTDYIRCAFYGNSITPEDMRRRQIADATFSTFAIIMDVYEFGTMPMTPVNIAEAGFDHWIWIGHPFFSLYGGICEAVYVRYVDEDGEERVIFKPDEINNSYPPHSPCDIFHKSGSMPCRTGFVSWSIPNRIHLKNKGNRIVAYSIVRGQSTETKLLDAPCIVSNPPTLLKIDTVDFKKGYKWWMRACSFSLLVQLGVAERNYVIVDSALRQHVQSALLTKYFNQWSWNSCLKAVNEFLEADPYYKKCELLLPAIFINYRLRVATGLYMETTKSKANLTGSMVAVTGNYMYQANQAMSKIGKEPEKYPWRQVVAASLGLGVFVAFQILRRKWTKLDSLPLDNSHIYEQIEHYIGYGLGRGIIGPIARVLHNLNVAAIETTVNVSCNIINAVESLAKAYLWPVFGAPIVEERLKRAFPNRLYPSILIGTLDVVGQPWPEQTLSTFLTRVACHSLAHYALASIPYSYAVRLHGLWNAFAVTCNIFSQTPVPALCTDSLWCYEAKERGYRCLYPKSKWIYTVTNMTIPAATSYFLTKCSDNEVTSYSLPEFDHAVQSNDYVDPGISFSTSYLPSEAFFPASECMAKYPLAYDPTVLADHDTLTNIFYADTRTPSDQYLGYFRYWAHNVPMYRPSTSGRNTYFMVINRLCKAPPALLEHPDRPSDKKSITEIMTVYTDPNLYYSCLLTYFDTPDPSTLCFNRSFYINYLKNLSKMRFINLPKPYKIAVYMVDKPTASFFETPEGYIEYEKHLPGPKKALMAEMKRKDDVNPITLTSPETNMTPSSSKTDEVLLKKDWVPRPIHREGPQFSYRVGRIIYGASENSKKYFWLRRISLCNSSCCCLSQSAPSSFHVMYLTDLSGKTDAALSEWFNYVIRTPGWHVAAAGDDSLCIFSRASTLYIFEGDVSQCDHSIRLSALSYEWFMLLSFGADPDTIKLLHRNATSNILIEHKSSKTKTYLNRSFERNTGSPDTTIGNTLIVLSIWAGFVMHYRLNYLFLNGFQQDALSSHQKFFLENFGFSMKIKTWNTGLGCDSFNSPTILKGWFLHTPNHPHEFTWSQLPSRILKLCKVMTHPNVIFKKTKIPKSHGFDVNLSQAWALLISMHKGMAPFVNLPYIDTWRELSYARYSLYTSKHLDMPPIANVPLVHESFIEQHRPTAAIRTCESDNQICHCWRDQFYDRYNVSATDLDDFITFLVNVTPLTFLSHPVLTSLATVDYY